MTEILRWRLGVDIRARGRRLTSVTGEPATEPNQGANAREPRPVRMVTLPRMTLLFATQSPGQGI